MDEEREPLLPQGEQAGASSGATNGSERHFVKKGSPNSVRKLDTMPTHVSPQPGKSKKWFPWFGKGKDRDDQQRQRSQSVYSHRRQRSHSRQAQPHRSLSASVGGGDVFVDFEANASSINSIPDDEMIEGDHSSCFLNSSDFEAVEAGSYGWDEPSTTRALDFCKKYVLNPYNFFLKVIGWRSFNSRYEEQLTCSQKACNVIYPMFIFLMLVVACFSQIFTCFSRSKSQEPEDYGNYTVLLCSHHLFTENILIYGLVYIAFFWSLYIFRFSDPEHLSSLSETVFLSYNYTSMRRSRTTPVFVLLAFLGFAALWVIASFGISILRMFALQLEDPNTIIEWFLDNLTAPERDPGPPPPEAPTTIPMQTYNILRYTFVGFSLVGFTFFDLLYIAVLTSYSSQCQLLIFYIANVIDRVRNKQYRTLIEASQEINHVYDFLKVLNGKLSVSATLVLFIALQNLVSAYIDLTKHNGHKHHSWMSLSLGFLNIAQWLFLTAIPVIQATRLTSYGNRLQRLGLEIASRPYVYSETPNDEIDFFLNFTAFTRFTAKIAFIPMYPSMVVGMAVLLLLCICLHVVIPSVDVFRWI